MKDIFFAITFKHEVDALLLEASPALTGNYPTRVDLVYVSDVPIELCYLYCFCFKLFGISRRRGWRIFYEHQSPRF